MKEKIRFFIKNYPGYVMNYPVSVGVAWFAVIQLIQFLGVWFNVYNGELLRAFHHFTEYSGEDFELLYDGHFPVFYLGAFCVIFLFVQREFFKSRINK